MRTRGTKFDGGYNDGTYRYLLGCSDRGGAGTEIAKLKELSAYFIRGDCNAKNSKQFLCNCWIVERLQRRKHHISTFRVVFRGELTIWEGCRNRKLQGTVPYATRLFVCPASPTISPVQARKARHPVKRPKF